MRFLHLGSPAVEGAMQISKPFEIHLEYQQRRWAGCAGNAIVLAFRTPRLLDKNALLSQAHLIEKRWSLPATKWLKVLAPSG